MTDREKRLEEAGEFMYRYFVMPGHAKLAKDCPNKNCPFCMWETALADPASDAPSITTSSTSDVALAHTAFKGMVVLRETPAEELRSLGIKAQQTDKGIEIEIS